MNHVGRPDVFCDFNSGARKLAEAHAVEKHAISHRGKTQARAKRDRQTRHDDGRGFCAAVTGKNHGNFMAARHERLRKRFHHVGEAAGFGKRQAFGCHEKDSHTYFGLEVRYKSEKSASSGAATEIRFLGAPPRIAYTFSAGAKRTFHETYLSLRTAGDRKTDHRARAC